MKELSYTKTDILIILSSLLCFTFLILTSSARLHKRDEALMTLAPFYMDFGKGTQEFDPDNVLSGNSGISEEYYNKQIHRFLSQNTD